MARALLAGILLGLLAACDGLIRVGEGVVYNVFATQSREFAEGDLEVLVTRLRALKHRLGPRIEASEQDGIRLVTIDRGTLPDDAVKCVTRYAGKMKMYSDNPQLPWLDHSNLETVEVSRTDGLYYLDFSLDDEVVERFRRLTRENVGEQLAMSIDGEVVSQGMIQSELGKKFRLTMLSKAKGQCFSVVLSHGVLSQPYKLIRQ